MYFPTVKNKKIHVYCVQVKNKQWERCTLRIYSWTVSTDVNRYHICFKFLCYFFVILFVLMYCIILFLQFSVINFLWSFYYVLYYYFYAIIFVKFSCLHLWIFPENVKHARFSEGFPPSPLLARPHLALYKINFQLVIKFHHLCQNPHFYCVFLSD